MSRMVWPPGVISQERSTGWSLRVSFFLHNGLPTLMKMAPARQVEYVSLEYCVSEKESEKDQMPPQL